MIVKPKIRGFICTTAHPVGCAQNVKNQIEYVKSQGSIEGGPKNVLVIGSSTGYGLSSRIVASFGCGAGTMGVFFEKASDGKRTATAGWYNSVAFDREAKEAGLYAKSFNGDAFSDEMKAQVIEAIKTDWGQVDCVIYSLASPRRTDPKTGEVYKSILKPCGGSYTNKSIDFAKNEVIEVTLPEATDEEVQGTVGVMGGEDWEIWMNALKENGCLADGAVSIAYSYIGPEITTAVYRNGTIGAAKDHLESTAQKLDEELKAVGGRGLVSVNKALVTQSSSAIPFIPLYFVILLKVMKEKGCHEGTIEQMYRLFADRMFNGKVLSDVQVDEKGRVRVDDWEMRADVQEEVMKIWEKVDTGNVAEVSDMAGYNSDFLGLFGFGVDGVDYDADVEIDLNFE